MRNDINFTTDLLLYMISKFIYTLLTPWVIVLVTGLSSFAQESQICNFTIEGESYDGTMNSGFCVGYSLFWRSYKYPDPKNRQYLEYGLIARNAGDKGDWDTAIINAKKAMLVYPNDDNAKRILLAATNAKKIQHGKITVSFDDVSVDPYQLWKIITGESAYPIKPEKFQIEGGQSQKG